MNTMNINKKFNPKQIEKLIDPKRLEFQSPELIWQVLDLKDPRVLVDIGAGTGFYAVPFAEKSKDCLVYACDSSPVMVEWMQENIPVIYQDRVVPVQCDETTVPLPSEIADLVYMINLHHELDDPQATLREAMRLLKQDGLLAVIDWKPERTPLGPPLEIRVPQQQIVTQFIECGFKDVKQHDVLSYHGFITGRK